MAGVRSELKLHDLRRWFNFRLQNHYDLSAKQAGAYLGNSEAVNDRHYTPDSEEARLLKLGLSPKN